MTLVVRLRIQLADRPGSLADVARAIGDYGGNIAMIDVLQGVAGAVDEVTVELPEDVNLGELRKQIDRVDGAQVISHQRAGWMDPIVRVLKRLTDALDERGPGPPESMRRSVAELLTTPAVWVLRPAAAEEYEAARLALEQPGTAMVVRTTEKLPPLGETISGEACLLAVAVPSPADPWVVLVGRSLAQGFTPTESSRVEALTRLYSPLLSGATMGTPPEPGDGAEPAGQNSGDQMLVRSNRLSH
jgi:hypothetical protein